MRPMCVVSTTLPFPPLAPAEGASWRRGSPTHVLQPRGHDSGPCSPPAAQGQDCVNPPRPDCGFPAWDSGKRATSPPAPRLFPAVPEDPALSHWEPWGAAAGRRVPSRSLPLSPGPLGHCCRRFARSQGLLALLSGTWVRVSLRGPSELAQDVGSWCGCRVATELPAQHCHC